MKCGGPPGCISYEEDSRGGDRVYVVLSVDKLTLGCVRSAHRCDKIKGLAIVRVDSLTAVRVGEAHIQERGGVGPVVRIACGRVEADGTVQKLVTTADSCKRADFSEKVTIGVAAATPADPVFVPRGHCKAVQFMLGWIAGASLEHCL